MKKIFKIYYLIIWVVLFAPSLVLASWKPGQPIVPECARTSVDGCHFNDIITLINNLLQVFIWVAVPVSTLLFAWIGWDFIVQGDKAGARTSAKKRLEKLLIGMFFVLAPVIIIKLIVGGLGDNANILDYVN